MINDIIRKNDFGYSTPAAITAAMFLEDSAVGASYVEKDDLKMNLFFSFSRQSSRRHRSMDLS